MLLTTELERERVLTRRNKKRQGSKRRAWGTWERAYSQWIFHHGEVPTTSSDRGSDVGYFDLTPFRRYYASIHQQFTVCSHLAPRWRNRLGRRSEVDQGVDCKQNA